MKFILNIYGQFESYLILKELLEFFVLYSFDFYVNVEELGRFLEIQVNYCLVSENLVVFEIFL